MGGTNTPTDFELDRADKATTWPEAVGYLVHAVADVQERLEEQAGAIEELSKAERRHADVDDIEEKPFERIQKLESKVRRLGEMISDGADTRATFGDALEKLDERLKSVEQGMGAIQSGKTQPTVSIEAELEALHDKIDAVADAREKALQRAEKVADEVHSELESRLDDLEHGLDFVAGEVSGMIEGRLEDIERQLEGGPGGYLEECAKEADEQLQTSRSMTEGEQKRAHERSALYYTVQVVREIVDKGAGLSAARDLRRHIEEVEQKVDDTDQLLGDVIELLSHLDIDVEEPGPPECNRQVPRMTQKARDLKAKDHWKEAFAYLAGAIEELEKNLALHCRGPDEEHESRERQGGDEEFPDVSRQYVARESDFEGESMADHPAQYIEMLRQIGENPGEVPLEQLLCDVFGEENITDVQYAGPDQHFRFTMDNVVVDGADEDEYRYEVRIRGGGRFEVRRMSLGLASEPIVTVSADVIEQALNQALSNNSE